MVHLYTWTTPNGRKPSILLAELGMPYELHKVDLRKDEQKSPSFLKLNPNGKIPVLVDNGVVVFESGAILQYLAEKVGRFLPRDPKARAEVLSWTYWQVGGQGPFFGQLGAFGREEPRNERAFQKFFKESQRLTKVVDGRLDGREWIASEYSIADVIIYPWLATTAEKYPDVLEGAERVARWMKRMEARPAVRKGMALEPTREAEGPTVLTPERAPRAPWPLR
jgi:GSH-dependent disulfide-bond oxidoreductase